jgi:cellobiose phosphorylase
MSTQFGEFSRQGNDYSIYRPDPPRAWFYSLTNGRIVSRIAQDGRGEQRDAISGQAITRPLDNRSWPHQPGRYVFIRDNDSGEYWSLFGQVGLPESFETTFGHNHVRINAVKDELEGSIIIFLPPEETCELWQIKIHNISGRKRRLSLFVGVEWPASRTTPVEVTCDSNALTCHQRQVVDGQLPIHFMAADHAIDSYDGFADAFLGRQANYRAPISVIDGRCSRSNGSGMTPIGVLQKNVTLGSQTTTEVSYFSGRIIGKGKTVSQAAQHGRGLVKRLVERYRKPTAVETAKQSVINAGVELTSRNLVKTPEPTFDAVLNYWTKHQDWIGLNDASSEPATRLVQLTAVVATDPAAVRSALLDYFAHQQKDGQWLNPKTYQSYIPLLVLSTISYLKETGDIALLDASADYQDGGSGSVLQHLVRGLEHVTYRMSRHHLPISQSAPTVGGNRSVEEQTVACQLFYSLRELIPFLEVIGEHELVVKYQRVSSRLREAITNTFWNRSWYGSQLIDGHRAGGFKRNGHHSISLAEQAWAVLSGVAGPDHGRKALSAARQQLLTRFGLKSLHPSYPQQTEAPQSSAAAGEFENGGIVLAEQALTIGAWAAIGDGDEAYRLFELTCPAVLGNRPEQYGAEPFTYPDFIYGPEHRLNGQGASSSSGLAASFFSLMLWQQVLGVQPTLGGLKIDPCLPRDWRKVELTRTFRGAEYHIRILNSFRQNKGVDRILVDGLRITGTVIPSHGTGVHFVEVVLS